MESEIERYHRLMAELPNTVFVFGSNLAGRHGAGAAREAHDRYGATWGVGVGASGQSYAIPTKDRDVASTLPITVVKHHINVFLAVAKTFEKQRTYVVTRVGCGLAGFLDAEIAPLFKEAPSNVILPLAWQAINARD